VNLKPVCFLLGLCYAASAPALGLGELNLRSSLGQPLHATVDILDAGETTAADCFSIAPSGAGIVPPPRTQLALEQTGSQTLLHIRTAQAVNDPIAQFVLVSNCEIILQREYVVLLDPPERRAPPIQVEAAPAIAPSLPPPAPRPSASRRNTGPETARAARTQGKATKPVQTASDTSSRLVLSGRRMAHASRSEFALKLDTSLPDLTRTLPEGLTATELSDENTALTRKLAHLESQLAEMHKRNAELEARRAAASPAPVVKPPARTETAQWPLYLLIFGALAGAGTLITWLRRRPAVPALPNDDLGDAWNPPSRMAMPGPDLTSENDPLPPPDVTPPTPERMFEFAPSPIAEDTEVNDDILDQAEVYVAHGHGDLAIHLLQEHVREAPTESPVPWLLLLDLLHREGDTAGYTAASAECRRHFNINLDAHPVSQDGEHSLGLEAYPHLMGRLVDTWGTPGIDAFFTDLIYDNRGGTRTGFDPGAYRDILLLRAIAQDVLPLAA
jgi:hypothetical protein